MKPATQFQKMRERRIERERLARELARAEAALDQRLCESNLNCLLQLVKPQHPRASNYQECIKAFAAMRLPMRPEWSNRI
ncbi:hypothetical protein [Acidovorax sp. K2F]|uniref:hypothetical protein n=1 Tax=Acidovorax sp. K2F TaxID=2978125 RepID=UPI0021B0A982|nr:hypothetical protein [Acidovorax sp. K2F]MCT6719447.1 hypothetical protein [Acidovorax sp. K2F]